MQITAEDIAAHDPDVLLPPEPLHASRYNLAVGNGRLAAKASTVQFVAICRNAMPFLPATLKLLERTGEQFRDWSAFIYENDSIDGTKTVLSEWADGNRRNIALNTHYRPHLNTIITPERTVPLAEYRSACQSWVRRQGAADYVIVFDTDPWGGWSVDGVMTGLAALEDNPNAFGSASYSWGEVGIGNGQTFPMHYDAFAARLNTWERRGQDWFHHWHPAVGSAPVSFLSAFGQLAIYRGRAYTQGKYDGSDCEHVTFHKSIHDRIGATMILNPSQRCVSFWVPK